MRNNDAPQTIYLKNYEPTAYLIDTVDLDVALDPARTIVKSQLKVSRRAGHASDAPLILHGENLELLSVAVNGAPVATENFDVDETSLTVRALPEQFTLSIEVANAPEKNTALSGLYLSNGMFCTQCEAEGFRRITYYLDRPDILAKFSTRVEADKTNYPTLLSNGNLIDQGDLENGRHFVRWSDPHPKPAYLFALVGGDLACVEDRFTTVSGRDVALKVFVQPQNKDKCDYTLDALKRSMRWDEETFGREYDLDIFMIVAVDHFNFGAMENKGLNIFNSAYVLASPQTATDQDYETIESIVAHEYFHNWSGNRVTCRDWFQLCLKEGFTVFRDQEFSADMRSRPVQRIKDVRRLWAYQFPEDAGPLAHPPRPDSYITIDNFYTATVYEKGAELARMLKLILGPEDFRKASDLYFERHDGTAATVEDFVKAMEDASGQDLTKFRRWYSDAGTPKVSVTQDHQTLTLSQSTQPTPGQESKPPRQIPISYVAYDPATKDMIAEGVFDLSEGTNTLALDAGGQRPIVSLLREFSAPVTLDHDQSIEDRLFLMAHDCDPFKRWAVTNDLWKDLSLSFARLSDLPNKDQALEEFGNALAVSLNDADQDPAFVAELLKAPSPTELAQSASVIDPESIVAGRRKVREFVAARLLPELSSLYERLKSDAPYSAAAEQAGPRALKNMALGLLVAAGDVEQAVDQSKTAENMTDEAAATLALALSSSEAREPAMSRFYEKWCDEPLVVNKWLAWCAMTPRETALDDIKNMLDHEAFDLGNPNKVRALLGVFSRENIGAFNQADGAGYEFFIEQLLVIDRRNPQLAARLTTTFESWRKLEPTRKGRVEQALIKLADRPGLSSNLFEMATRLLGRPA